MTNTVWACAKVSYKDEKLLHSLARTSATLISDFIPQSLANTAWAFATLECLYKPFFTAIAEETLRKLSQIRCQELCNLVWALATFWVTGASLISALADAALVQVPEFNAQDLANAAWAFAKINVQSPVLMIALARKAIDLPNFNAGALTNSLWALATLKIQDPSLLDEMAFVAVPNLSSFRPQELANTTWAFVALTVNDAGLTRALTQEASARITDPASDLRQSFNAITLLAMVSTLGQEDGQGDSEMPGLLSDARKLLREHGGELDRTSTADCPIDPDLFKVTEERPFVLMTTTNMLVLQKPPGWMSTGKAHSGLAELTIADGHGSSLEAWLCDNFGDGHPVTRDQAVAHGLVHRLDRDTSGALLVARTYAGYYDAKLTFGTRAVEKDYVCLCHEWLQLSSGMIDAPLTSLGPGKPKAYVRDEGRPARTKVIRVLHLLGSAGEQFSFVELRLHTGRQHQIRAHLSHLGHPLVGDSLYGGEEVPWCPRTFLHSRHIGLSVLGEPLRVLSPLQQDLKAALQNLEAKMASDQSRLDFWRN